MLEQFLNHIESLRLIQPGQKVLLAVSGGLDSMVMLHLFKQAQFDFGVAHCNFQLRGEESDGDEKLIKDTCADLGINFFTKRFSTTEFAATKGISIQMAARELRYKWFDAVLITKGYDLLATAHHLNDNLETVLLNLVRGTGLDGLTGIPFKNEKIIRPLLQFKRALLWDFAQNSGIRWREDESNASDQYDRNYIRHNVIPLLKSMNPSLEEGFLTTVERLIGANGLVADQIRILREKLVEKRGNSFQLSINGILSSTSPEVTLWYLIREDGFSFDQCKKIVEPHQIGKSFYAKDNRLTIDRAFYLLSRVEVFDAGIVTIEQNQPTARFENLAISIEVMDKIPEIEKNPTVAMLDADTIEFPLQWRTWVPGDHFIPLGMEQQKKVSNFLIDQKIPLPEKEKVTVLESGGKICWIVGHRIGDLFKVTDNTKRVIIIRNIQ